MNPGKLILTVDHNQRNLELLGQVLGQAGYETLAARSLDEFAQALTQSDRILLALVDLAGFDRSIWECCEQLRAREIPLLVISPRQSAGLQQESLAHGATGFLVKPLVVHELLGIITSLLE